MAAAVLIFVAKLCRSDTELGIDKYRVITETAIALPLLCDPPVPATASHKRVVPAGFNVTGYTVKRRPAICVRNAV